MWPSMDPYTKPRATNSHVAPHAAFHQDSGLWARYVGFALGQHLGLDFIDAEHT